MSENDLASGVFSANTDSFASAGIVGNGAGDSSSDENKKTAIVAIVGRPSCGKSTFLNAACQEPVSIVSAVPQTTRDAIRGIVNTSLGQLVFVDTPGYHESEKKLNLKLRSVTESQLKDADVVLYIVDATRKPAKEEALTAELVAPFAKRTIVAINKIDEKRANIFEAHDFVKQVLPELPPEQIYSMSAKTDEGVEDVLRALYSLAPVAPALYPTDLYTDQDIPFRVSEVIRGEAINRLEEEIPHALYVDVADCEVRKNGELLWIRAFLCVERESQKGIVIGSGASMIKSIRQASIKKMKDIFGCKIELDLHVKVNKNWRQKDGVLKKLIK